MRVEPPLDRTALLAAVRRAYQVPAEALTFVPFGFDGACYVVSCDGGTRYFLKCWPQRRVDAGFAPLAATLSVTRVLHARGLVPRVAYPLPTQSGALWTQIGTMPLALYPLLAGQPPPFPLPHTLRLELARSMALIHAATPAVAGILPQHDSYAIPDETTVLQNLAAVEHVHSGQRPGLQALHHLVVPRVADVLAQYARLRALRVVVQNLTGPHVLCHRDLTGNNLLVDEQGQLSIVDWDAAALAPPEHDLWVLIGEDFDQLLGAYWQAGGGRALHVQQFEFYLLRRYLGDMLARLVRLLETETGEQDEELLRGMDAYGFSRWAGLDATLREIAVALAQ